MTQAKIVTAIIDPRSPGRRSVMMSATMRLPGGDTIDATITDLSQNGFRATIDAHLAEGALIRIDLPVGSAPRAKIVWSYGDRVGCAFLTPLATDEVRLIAEIWDGAAGPGLA
jgi:hypothetical protein